VAVVHAETSTGVRNEVAPLRALQETDTLFLLDTVTSLGGIPVEIDAWGVDAAYSATQKCLGAVSGLAPITPPYARLPQVNFGTSRSDIAGRFDLPLGVVRVLLCDLLMAGMIARYDPPDTEDLPDINTLQAVIHGLRSI